MNITVTKDDIHQGQRRDPEECAIARALLRAGLDHFGVMGPSVMVSDSWDRLTSVKLPEAVSDWIFNFDAGNTVSPFSFELQIPESFDERNPGLSRKFDEACGQTCHSPLSSNSELLSIDPIGAKPFRRGRGSLKVPKLSSKPRARFAPSFKTA